MWDMWSTATGNSRVRDFLPKHTLQTGDGQTAGRGTLPVMTSLTIVRKVREFGGAKQSERVAAGTC